MTAGGSKGLNPSMPHISAVGGTWLQTGKEFCTADEYWAIYGTYQTNMPVRLLNPRKLFVTLTSN